MSVLDLACLLSGAAALALEVCWQRALAAVLGGEARSVCLVLGVFLASLSLGYRFWGARATRSRSGALALAAAARVRLALAFSAAATIGLLDLALRLTPRLPSGFLFDGLIAAAIVGPPAFLMGGALPLLVGSRQSTLARIYGLNTIGACAGAWLGGFWTVPEFGVSRTIEIAVLFEVLTAAAIAWTSRRAHNGELESDHPRSTALSWRLVTWAFVSGAAVMALEVIVTRLFSMTLGPTVFVFPLVLGQFVLGIGLGSLTLRKTARLTTEATWAVALLLAVYLSVSYWPNWAFLARRQLEEVPGTFVFFWIEAALLTGVLIVPLTMRLGRLLPLCALESGDSGRAYAANALGTVFGACGIGYLAARALDLDALFRVVLVLLGLAIAGATRRRAGARNAGVAVLGALVVVVSVSLPRWDRRSYNLGLFSGKAIAAAVERGEATGRFFAKPALIDDHQILYGRDAPDATVVVADFPARPPVPASRSLILNGKSDGNTYGDYPTMALLGVIPYLLAESPAHLRTAVVGAGTGVTAGVLARLRDVSRVELIEIVPEVLDALRFFSRENANVATNPKVTLVADDAFRRFGRAETGAFDLVVAESSNPWVAGNETLYTREFYRRVAAHLAARGSFTQWFHLYEMSDEALRAIFANLAGAFARADVFLLASGDAFVVAGGAGLPHLAAQAPNATRRFAEPGAVAAAMRSGLFSLDELAVLHLFDERYMRWFASSAARPAPDLDHPWLGARAAAAQFYSNVVTAGDLVLPQADRRLIATPGKAAALRRLVAAHPHGLPQCFEERYAMHPLCLRFAQLARAAAVAEQPPGSEPDRDFGWHRLLAYRELRQNGFHDPDPSFLKSLRSSSSDEMSKQMRVAIDKEIQNDASF